MSAKKNPEELAEDFSDKCFNGEVLNQRFDDCYLAGYRAGQANPTPEATLKLMPSKEEFLKFGNEGNPNGRQGEWAYDYIVSELKRRAEGEQ